MKITLWDWQRVLSEVPKVKKTLHQFTFHSEILGSELTLFPIVLHDFIKLKVPMSKCWYWVLKITLWYRQRVLSEVLKVKKSLHKFTFHSEMFWIDAFSYRFTRLHKVEHPNVQMFVISFENNSVGRTEGVVRISQSEENPS